MGTICRTPWIREDLANPQLARLEPDLPVQDTGIGVASSEGSIVSDAWGGNFLSLQISGAGIVPWCPPWEDRWSEHPRIDSARPGYCKYPFP